MPQFLQEKPPAKAYNRSMEIALVGDGAEKVAVPASLGYRVARFAGYRQFDRHCREHPQVFHLAVVEFRDEESLAGFVRSRPVPGERSGSQSGCSGGRRSRSCLAGCFPDFYPDDSALLQSFDYTIPAPLGEVNLLFLAAQLQTVRDRGSDVDAGCAEAEGLKSSFQDLERRIQERTNELQNFVYTVSHDLKTPLHAARGFADLIKRKFHPYIRSDDDLFMLKRLEENISQSILMIDNLLQLSRLGTTEMKMEPVYLSELIDSYIREHQTLKNRDGELEVCIETELPPVQGDRNRLVQLLNNIFDNSVKYRRGDDAFIEVNARRKDGYVQVEMRDKGSGMTADDVENVFKVFYRGENAAGIPDGSGVGLTIVKKIVEQHGGTISLTSSPGTGTCVHFSLPSAET
jgi:signal transduction histidine kinase